MDTGTLAVVVSIFPPNDSSMNLLLLEQPLCSEWSINIESPPSNDSVQVW